LSKSSFVVGAKAKDKNDYIVYDKSKGALYYDADGSGKGAAVKFAQLKKGLVIDHKDFFVI
jgi:Ca2+-binding RTX toxin-like protein